MGENVGLHRDDNPISESGDTLTRPPARHMFIITQDDLDALKAAESDRYYHAFLGSFFLAAGLAPNSCSTIIVLAHNKLPPFTSILELFLFVVLLTSALWFGVFFRARLRTPEQIVAEIEKRPRYPLQYDRLPEVSQNELTRRASVKQFQPDSSGS